jgi:PAS domain S-box-containing protein
MSRRAVGSTRLGEGRTRPRALHRALVADGMMAPSSSAALLHLPDGVVLTDERQRICWSNAAMARLTGWTADELMGMPLGLLITGEQLDAIARARGVELRQLQRYHCSLREKSGESSEVSVTVGRDDSAGRLLTIYVLRDLRRQRELEGRLLAELDENQALKVFGRKASGVVHDLRHLNNLFGVTLRNLRRHRDDGAFVEEALRMLGHATDHMRQLLAALSAEPARSGLRRQPVDIRGLVRHALDLLAGMDRPDGVVTSVEGFEQPLFCEVDSDEMLRVIFNVLVNAFDAVRKDGQVTIRGEMDGRKHRVRLIVEDSGPGLAPAYLERDLFRPFRSTKPDGLGLGLYLAKSILDSHGGNLVVTNRERGAGARVIIGLPAAPVRPAWSPTAENGTHASA